MLLRVYVLLVLAALATSPCYAAKPIVRDGSTKEKAIPLKQRGLKAIDEEIGWMVKMFHYTPALATRDVLLEAARKAVETGKTVHPPKPWRHATLEHAGRYCSYWMLRTPNGERHIYFDTGISTNTPGEVVRQESSRAQYLERMIDSLSLNSTSL